jgi:hypothetical protein
MKLSKTLNNKKQITINNNKYISFTLNNLFQLKSYLNNKIPQNEIIKYKSYILINTKYLTKFEITLSN